MLFSHEINKYAFFNSQFQTSSTVNIYFYNLEEQKFFGMYNQSQEYNRSTNQKKKGVRISVLGQNDFFFLEKHREIEDQLLNETKQMQDHPYLIFTNSGISPKQLEV